METPMQEVYDNFNKMSDADFRAWMLNNDLLEKEYEMMINLYNHATIHGILVQSEIELIKSAQTYYEETFNTKD